MGTGALEQRPGPHEVEGEQPTGPDCDPHTAGARAALARPSTVLPERPDRAEHRGSTLSVAGGLIPPDEVKAA